MVTTEMQNIPERVSDSEVLQILGSNIVDGNYVSYVKEISMLRDESVSDWFNVNVKTFRSYKKQGSQLKENLQEQVILLISLYKHGLEVFGEVADFNQWLQTENFYLNDQMPISYLKTITGIRFVDDRLTAMEYGDNV